MDLIIKDVCRAEERLNLISCIERVPSQSNPSDVLSRELVHKFLGVDRSWIYAPCGDNVWMPPLKRGETRWHQIDVCDQHIPTGQKERAALSVVRVCEHVDFITHTWFEASEGQMQINCIYIYIYRYIYIYIYIYI